jgi:hypothetical protein
MCWLQRLLHFRSIPLLKSTITLFSKNIEDTILTCQYYTHIKDFFAIIIFIKMGSVAYILWESLRAKVSYCLLYPNPVVVKFTCYPHKMVELGGIEPPSLKVCPSSLRAYPVVNWQLGGDGFPSSNPPDSFLP